MLMYVIAALIVMTALNIRQAIQLYDATGKNVLHRHKWTPWSPWTTVTTTDRYPYDHDRRVSARRLKYCTKCMAEAKQVVGTHNCRDAEGKCTLIHDSLALVDPQAKITGLEKELGL